MAPRCPRSLAPTSFDAELAAPVAPSVPVVDAAGDALVVVGVGVGVAIIILDCDQSTSSSSSFAVHSTIPPTAGPAGFAIGTSSTLVAARQSVHPST
jgi:hypothetical protein